MPTYEYLCDECGPFSEMAPLSAFALPQPCPACGQQSARNLMTAPALGGAAAPAAAAPKGPRHASSCGCCAPRRPLRAEAVGARK